MKDMSPLEQIRHSCSHVLATAILRLFPETQLDIGPPTESGFYYDIDLDKKLDATDLEAIELEMKKVIKENQKFILIKCSREEAMAKIKEIGQERYKLGRLDDIPEGEQVSFYQNGEFIDLCAGSHVSYTKKIKAYKLLSIAGAYHRGDEKNKQLQRIYGTAFASKEELTEYLERLEQAKARDHRKLGKELKLFHVDETVGAGMVLWTPNGAVIRQELQNFIAEELRMADYDQVFTPHIGKLGLFRTSGHFPYYKDSQYPPLVERDLMNKLADEGCSCGDLSNMMKSGEIDGYMLKPMNCPHHVKIYASQARSYRNLPLRLAEFGTVYRWEQSGEISGLTRVRGFTQDDAHLFVTEDQLADEVLGCIELVQIIFDKLGMEEYRVRVGLRDPDSTKYVGDPKRWDKAEDACRAAAESLGVPWSEEEGEAAFYGPKIDFVVKDVIGREWQLGTVQVDYNLPERFDLTYKGSDGELHRPVMIHRAPFGSMERFCGVLIEHFAGRFPTWLTPTQCHVITIREEHKAYAAKVAEALRAAGVRVDVDDSDNNIMKKIRNHRKLQPAYLVILGDEESQNNTVSLRARNGDQVAGVPLDDFVANLVNEISEKISQPALVPPSAE